MAPSSSNNNNNNNNNNAPKLFLFGIGFTATRTALAFAAKGFEIAGTVRSEASARALAERFPQLFHWDEAAQEQAHENNSEQERRDVIKRQRNVFIFSDNCWDLTRNGGISAVQALKGTTHLITSIPPNHGTPPNDHFLVDPVLATLQSELTSVSTLKWIAYLSTIGVYGETNGNTVDETAPVHSNVRRSQLRIQAEQEWFQLQVVNESLACHSFRIAGIYGPHRGPLLRVRAGQATRIHIPGRLFHRIHVDDIVQIIWASSQRPRAGGIYNVCDEEPAPADLVTTYCHELLGIQTLPPVMSWEEASGNMSEMAKSFYAESKIVASERIKSELGVKLLYPTFREGLLAQVLEEEAEQEGERAGGGSAPIPLDCKLVQDAPVCLLVNNGSLKAQSFLQLRQVAFQLSRRLRMVVVPCSFRFSDRIDPGQLNGIPAQTLEQVLVELARKPFRTKSARNAQMVVVLPLFIGESATLTDFLPVVLHRVELQTDDNNKNNNTETNNLYAQKQQILVAKSLVDVHSPSDDRIARILLGQIRQALTTQHDPLSGDKVSVLVVDHGTPTKQVHDARRLVTNQLIQLLKKEADQVRVDLVGDACMERREGSEYDFNDPLLLNALDHYAIRDGLVLIALLFLSKGRHAGADGDLEEIVNQLRAQAEAKALAGSECGGLPKLVLLEPIGKSDGLTDLLQSRFEECYENLILSQQ